jgi:hypothetical protein
MKTHYSIPNYRQFKVKYLGATTYRGARVKIYEPKRYNDDKEKSVVLSYDYEIGDILEQAIIWLTEKGFKIISRSSEYENYILLVDNWGDNFQELG